MRAGGPPAGTLPSGGAAAPCHAARFQGQATRPWTETRTGRRRTTKLGLSPKEEKKKYSWTWNWVKPLLERGKGRCQRGFASNRRRGTERTRRKEIRVRPESLTITARGCAVLPAAPQPRRPQSLQQQARSAPGVRTGLARGLSLPPRTTGASEIRSPGWSAGA